MHRRDLLRLFSATSALVAAPPTTTVFGAGSVEAAAVQNLPDGLDGYAALNEQLWRVFSLAPVKSQVMPLVRTQLDLLCQDLRQSHGQVPHQRLCVLTADLFQLAGEIFFDTGAHTEAAHCYTLATSAAKEADAFDLWACALTRQAFLAVYERQFGQAASLLEPAASLASRGDSALSTRHWVSVVRAHAFAGLGDLSACEQQLDTANEVRSLSGVVHNGGWLRFDGSRLPEERGTCYLNLGRTDLAETALAQALKTPLTMRRRAGVLTDLAVIGAHRQDPEQIVEHATAVLATARRSSSGVVGHRLLGLRPHLTPFLHHPGIQRASTTKSAT